MIARRILDECNRDLSPTFDESVTLLLHLIAFASILSDRQTQAPSKVMIPREDPSGAAFGKHRGAALDLCSFGCTRPPLCRVYEPRDAMLTPYRATIGEAKITMLLMSGVGARAPATMKMPRMAYRMFRHIHPALTTPIKARKKLG